MITLTEKSNVVKRIAKAVGFDLCGVAAAAPVGRADYVRKWLAEGRGGTMSYLHRYLEQRLDATKLVPGAQSVIVVALNYHQDEPVPDELRSADGCRSGSARRGTAPSVPSVQLADDEPRGRVAMYAWGADYHKVVKRKLFALADQLRDTIDEPFEAKACVDTAPLLEREVAAAAGLGWIGKNTLVLNESLGSYFFLGAIVTTLTLAPDEPSEDHCGTCTACLDACPTQAFPAPYEMDASRCISYLTIEHREPINPALHAAMGDWVFGCDVCQEVCPHNRKAPTTTEPVFAIRNPSPQPRLSEILNWSDADYRETLRGSAIKRAKHEMLQRNAKIAMRNARAPRRDA